MLFDSWCSRSSRYDDCNQECNAMGRRSFLAAWLAAQMIATVSARAQDATPAGPSSTGVPPPAPASNVPVSVAPAPAPDTPAPAEPSVATDAGAASVPLLEESHSRSLVRGPRRRLPGRGGAGRGTGRHRAPADRARLRPGGRIVARGAVRGLLSGLPDCQAGSDARGECPAPQGPAAPGGARGLDRDPDLRVGRGRLYGRVGRPRAPLGPDPAESLRRRIPAQPDRLGDPEAAPGG